MIVLLKVRVNTDWKGRPHTEITVLDYSQVDTPNVRQMMLDKQDLDIEEIKKADIKSDIEVEAEKAGDEGREPVPHSGEWQTSERWEMARVGPDDLRTLCGMMEGETWSITYYIVKIG